MRSASCIGTWRVTAMETPIDRYSQTPTPSASSSAAVSRSTRAARPSIPSRKAAALHTARKTVSGTAARWESS
ncbi:MAG TPA: hypothetical protein VGJ27_09430 [Gaiellaceae bacterium]